LGQAGIAVGDDLPQPGLSLLGRRRSGAVEGVIAGGRNPAELADQQAGAAGHQAGIHDPVGGSQGGGAELEGEALEPPRQQQQLGGGGALARRCRQLQHTGPAALQHRGQARPEPAATATGGQHQLLSLKSIAAFQHQPPASSGRQGLQPLGAPRQPAHTSGRQQRR